MDTTLQRLDSIVTSIQSTATLCLESKSRKHLLSVLASSVAEVNATVSHLKENEKRNYIAVRKALVAVANVFSGMESGLADKALSPVEFRKHAKTLTSKFLPMVRDGLVEEMEAKQHDTPLRESSVPEGVRGRIKIVLSKTAELKDAVNVVATSNSAGYEVHGNERMSPIESLALLTRQALPVKIPGSFKIVRVPIIPVFHNPVLARSETLNKIGLKNQSIEGFTVLMDQILLLVSKKQAASTNVTPVATAHSVVELLNDRGAVKYEIVSDTPNANPRNTDLLMFWILQRPRMAALMRVLGSAKVKWGLPLPSEQAEVEKLRVEKLSKEQEEFEAQRETAIQEAAALREKKEKARELSKQRRIDAQKAETEAKKKRISEQEQKRRQVLDSKIKALVRKSKALHTK